MNDSTNPRSLLLGYLLDELPPGERERVEERMLQERAFSDQLQEAEYDLADDYHAGRLSRSERIRVEKAFSRERLAEIASISGEWSTLRNTPKEESRSTHERAALRLAPAILAVAALAVGVFYVHLRQEKSARTASIAGSAATQSSPRGLTGSAPPGLQPAPASAASELTATASLVLSGESMRGPGSLLLELRPSTRRVQVQWVVPGSTTDGAFRLSILHDNSTMITAEQAAFQKIDGRQIAMFNVDASVFDKGSTESHLLFVIRTATVAHSIEGEYPVLVLRRAD